MEHDDELAEWVSKTHQLIGRNLLLFQRLEHLLKLVLPRATVSVSPDTDVQSRKDQGYPEVETCTLGALVKRFIDEVCDPNEPPPTDDSDGLRARATFRLRFETSEGREALIKRLKALVEGRNRLVHHLLSEVDVNSPASWRSIHDQLEAQHQKVLTEIETLRHLVDTMAISGALVAHPEIRPELVCGPIREHLIEKLRVAAEKSAGPDGWTSVSAAIQSDRPISSDAIKELLRHFDVRNLSAFLEAVGGFEIRHDKDQKGGPRAFYRVPGTQSPTATDSTSHQT